MFIDIRQNTTTHAQSTMNISRYDFGMTAVANHCTIVVCGGRSTVDNTTLSECEQYVNGLWMWVWMAPMPIGVSLFAMITLENTRVYVFGGLRSVTDDNCTEMYNCSLNYRSFPIDNVSMYDFDTQNWTQREPMLVSAYGHAAVAIGR